MPRSSSSPAAAAAARRMLLVCFFSRLVTVQWLGGGTAAAAWVLVRRSSLLPPPRSSGGGPGARPTTAQFQQSSSSSDGLTAPISLKTTIPTADPQSQHAQVLLTSHQIDFVRGYLNKHHSDLLLAFAAAFSSLGSEMAIANVWSGGSFSLVSARLTDIAASLEEDDTTSNNNNNDTAKPNVSQLSLILAVTVHRRGKTPEERTVAIPLTANPIPERLRSYDAALVALVVPTTTAATVDDADSTTATTTTKTRSYVPQPIDTVVRHLCRLCAIVNQPDVAGKLIQLAIQLEGSGIGKLPENMYDRVVIYIYIYIYACTIRLDARQFNKQAL